MKKIPAIIVLIISIAINANGQSNPDSYKNVEEWSKARDYQSIVNWYEIQENNIELGRDSLGWILYRVSIAYLNQGNVTTSEKVLSTLFEEVNSLSADLKLRIYDHYARLLTEQSKYNQAITEFNKVKTLIDSNIIRYQSISDTTKARLEQEKLAKLYINRSIAYFYLGNLPKYGENTKKALSLTNQINSTRQNLIARRNLIEYYELTNHWDSVSINLDQYISKLNTIQKEEPGINNELEIARYKIRLAVNSRENQKEYNYAIQLLTEALTITSSEKRYEIYTDALYELIATLIQSNRPEDAVNIIEFEETNPLILNNQNATAILKARKLQLYITLQHPRLDITLNELQTISKVSLGSEAESVILHTLIKYYTGIQQDFTARLLLSELINKSIDNQNITKTYKQAINQKIQQLYQQYAYQDGQEKTREEITELMLELYRQKQIEEWLFDKDSSFTDKLILIIIITLCIGILAVVITQKKLPKASRAKSVAYKILSRQIKDLDKSF